MIRWSGLALMLVAMVPVAHAAEPYVADLVYGTKDLVPVVQYDVTKAPYSADNSGRTDCTEAFTAALADANEHGGTVFVPGGRYRIEGNLTIPKGVTLRGDWKEPTERDVSVKGTILLAYAGRGQADGTAFIKVDAGGLRDVSIFYPEQKASNITPYPETITMTTGGTARNVTLVNSYVGLITSNFCNVFNVYGTPLHSGVIMLRAAAVPRCRTIRLSPRYWAESGLEGAPTFSALASALKKRKAYGVQLNRQDAGIFIDVVIDHYHTGLKFMPPHGWTYWHDVHVTNADIGIHFTGGSDHRAYMTDCSFEGKDYGVLMKHDQTGWGENWIRLSKSNKPYGLPRDVGNLRMFACTINSSGPGMFLSGDYKSKINLQECTFERWGSSEWAIDVEEGSSKAVTNHIVIYDSDFKQSKQHVRVAGRSDMLEIIGNEFTGAPDIRATSSGEHKIDHAISRQSDRSMPDIKPIPDRLPGRTDIGSFYLATASPYLASNDGEKDATMAIQSALDAAGKAGGGTVYLPQGRYRLTDSLKVPAGVELRGVNDTMHRGTQIRTLLIADVPGDRGKPNNDPLITLASSFRAGGSGLAGLAIWYPHQDYRKIDPYPWTVRSLGPKCWMQRVYLGNCYNAVDFATHDSDQHLLSQVVGSALNIAFNVGKCRTIGWIDNCHIRPQDWSLLSAKDKPATKRRPAVKAFPFDIPGDEFAKPTTKQIFRGTEFSLIPNMRGAGTITINSGANEQITAYFTNGSTRAFDFLDDDGTGGGNANVLIGGSEAGWGAWVKAIGTKGATIVNFSFNPMTRLEYTKPGDIKPHHLPKGLAVRVEKTVPTDARLNLIMPKFYGRKDVDLGMQLRGGDLFIKQAMISGGYKNQLADIQGGKVEHRNTLLGDDN